MTVNRRPTSRQEDNSAKRLMALLKAGGDMRIKKVRKLRAVLRAGQYENDLKLSVTAERLLKEL
jgi:hypothetical protein